MACIQYIKCVPVATDGVACGLSVTLMSLAKRVNQSRYRFGADSCGSKELLR